MEEKVKKPIYKKWWFWLIIILIGIGIGGSAENTQPSSDTYKKNTSEPVVVIDFSTKNRDEVQPWFDNNKINGTIADEYSNTIAKGAFVSQSIPANTTIHQGDKIKIVYSLGKEPTMEEKNALAKAESYSNTMNMSKNAIYKQLTSSFEGFSNASAQYAIDNIKADWNKNALEKAKSYQQTMNMSKNAIYKQLTSSFEGFTKAEAQYAIDNLEN